MKNAKSHIGRLGEAEAERMVEACIQDFKLKQRVSVLVGVTLASLLVWWQLTVFYAMAG
jgi:hypothetical protein